MIRFLFYFFFKLVNSRYGNTGAQKSKVDGKTNHYPIPKELVGVIRGLANPGLRVEGQQVQLHTQPCLEFEVRQERRGGKDHGV